MQQRPDSRERSSTTSRDAAANSGVVRVVPGPPTSELDSMVPGRLDRKGILVRNANIDTATVAEHDRLVQELRRAGVRLKRPQSSYRLEHPLGGDRLRFRFVAP